MPNRPGSQLCRPAIEPPFGFAADDEDDDDTGAGAVVVVAIAVGTAIALWFII